MLIRAVLAMTWDVSQARELGGAAVCCALRWCCGESVAKERCERERRSHARPIRCGEAVISVFPMRVEICGGRNSRRLRAGIVISPMYEG